MNKEQWEVYKEKDYSMDALVGQTGLEQAFEEYLHGIDGTRVDVVTKSGQLVRSYYETEPQAGKNVQVSIDLKLQAIAEDTLATTIANLRDPKLNPEEDGRDAGGAAAVAMDIKTGQVLVCASYPTYDLSTLFENYAALLEDKTGPLFNRALQAAYPPGSTYKMSMVVGGIDSGEIKRNTHIQDKGVFTKYAGFSPKCLRYSSSGKTHGSIDCTDALKVSCNYFFYVLGDRMSLEDMDNTAKGLGLGEPTGIELYEAVGHRANAETKAKLNKGENAKWFKGDQVLAAIGQSENKFTPIQLCSYVTTLVNQGTRYKATFLDRVVSSDYRSVFLENTVQIQSQMEMSDEAHAAVAEGMRKVANVSGGTAYKIFKDYPITVCAKTGTAQTGLKDASDNGAFVCYAPAEDPQIAVVVYGEKAGHGSSLGEVARSILDSYFGLGSGSTQITGENQLG
jgi:penicillin-binding protein 2